VPPVDVPITTEHITLGQLLKLTGTVEVGGDVRSLLASRTVTVDGEVEDRRGRKLRPGAVVRVAGDELRVVRSSGG